MGFSLLIGLAGGRYWPNAISYPGDPPPPPKEWRTATNSVKAACTRPPLVFSGRAAELCAWAKSCGQNAGIATTRPASSRLLNLAAFRGQGL